MKPRQGSRIGRIFADGRRIDEVLKFAVREAIRTHQECDAPIAVWRDGRTAWIPARELNRFSAASTKRKVATKRSG